MELAWNLARADIENAWRVARTPQERNNAEIDLAFISGDWRGMRARIERFAAEQGCSQASWMENISLPFGYAKQVRQRNREFTICDPMGSGTWRSAVRSELWAGDLDAALDTAQKGSELAPGDWLTILLVSALVARGELEAAESEITSRLKQDTPILSTRLMVASARGDRDEWQRIMDTDYPGAEGNSYWKLTYFAWGGDRVRANEVAATIDAHVFGSQGLATIALWCLCGAPWDLESTPGFAADLEESGLSWPPASPISFPLKTW